MTVEIDFIPIVVVQVWRVVVWVVSLALLGSITQFLPQAWRARNNEAIMSRWALDLYTAVAIFVFQGCVAQAVRWHTPLMLQGLPITTFAIVWCVSARVRRARTDASRRAGDS
jgi:hypothetical protein